MLNLSANWRATYWIIGLLTGMFALRACLNHNHVASSTLWPSLSAGNWQSRDVAFCLDSHFLRLSEIFCLKITVTCTCIVYRRITRNVAKRNEETAFCSSSIVLLFNWVVLPTCSALRYRQPCKPWTLLCNYYSAIYVPMMKTYMAVNKK